MTDLSQFLADIPAEHRPMMAAALEMAEKAGEIHLRYFRSQNLEQSTKLNDSDVVTVADKESEAAIVGYIHEHFPSHGIIAEESGREHDDREWRWVVDPLDGTTNFAMGLPPFCVSIALEHCGEAVLGVVFAPYLNECFYAVKGGGAWLNGKRLACSDKGVLSKPSSPRYALRPQRQSRQQPSRDMPHGDVRARCPPHGLGGDGSVLYSSRLPRRLLGAQSQPLGCGGRRAYCSRGRRHSGVYPRRPQSFVTCV